MGRLRSSVKVSLLSFIVFWDQVKAFPEIVGIGWNTGGMFYRFMYVQSCQKNNSIWGLIRWQNVSLVET